MVGLYEGLLPPGAARIDATTAQRQRQRPQGAASVEVTATDRPVVLAVSAPSNP